MDICCYILFSPKLKRFYTGACQENLIERIKKHNEHTYGKDKYTSVTDDWELFLKVDVTNYAHAIRLERKIKTMKSSKFIRNLAKYNELVEKIKLETR